MAEYAHLEYIDTLPDNIDRAGNDALAVAFKKVLDSCITSVAAAREQKLPGTQGEIVSHSLLRVGNHLVVSFLLRQE